MNVILIASLFPFLSLRSKLPQEWQNLTKIFKNAYTVPTQAF